VSAQTDEAWSSPKQAALAEAHAARRSATLASGGRRDSYSSDVSEVAGRLKALPSVSPAERVMRKTPSKVYEMADIQKLGSPERELMTGGVDSVGSSQKGSANDSDAASAASMKSDTSKNARGPRSIQAAMSVVTEAREVASSSSALACSSSAAACQDAATDESSAPGSTKSQRRKAARKRRTESTTRSGNVFGDIAPELSALGSSDAVGDIEAGQAQQPE